MNHYKANKGLSEARRRFTEDVTVYLERAIGALRQQGRQVDEGLLKHFPLADEEARRLLLKPLEEVSPAA